MELRQVLRERRVDASPNGKFGLTAPHSNSRLLLHHALRILGRALTPTYQTDRSLSPRSGMTMMGHRSHTFTHTSLVIQMKPSHATQWHANGHCSRYPVQLSSRSDGHASLIIPGIASRHYPHSLIRMELGGLSRHHAVSERCRSSAHRMDCDHINSCSSRN